MTFVKFSLRHPPRVLQDLKLPLLRILCGCILRHLVLILRHRVCIVLVVEWVRRLRCVRGIHSCRARRSRVHRRVIFKELGVRRISACSLDQKLVKLSSIYFCSRIFTILVIGPILVQFRYFRALHFSNSK